MKQSQLFLISSILVLVKLSSALFPTAATSSASVIDDVGRRCIGELLDSYARGGDGDDNGDSDSDSRSGGRKDQSILSWLNENTSCELPSDSILSSNPSWKRKSKNLNSNHAKKRVEDGTTEVCEDDDLPYHVVMLLMENQSIRHEIVALSAGFLVAGLEVTIFYMFQDDALVTSQKNQEIIDSIQADVFDRIPFSANLNERAQDLFRLVKLNLNDYVGKVESKSETNSYTVDLNEVHDCKQVTAAHPLNRCSIEIAPVILKLLLDEIDNHIGSKPRGKKNSTSKVSINDKDDGNYRRDQFDFVMMMDASFLGGLLFSEIKLIPTIAIGSHDTLMLAIEHEPEWIPSPKRTTLDRIDKIFLQRLYSLGLTGVFLQVNKMRLSLGLQGLERIKSPLDIFLPAVAMLVDLIPSDVAFPLVSPLSLVSQTSSTSSSYIDDNSRYRYSIDDFRDRGQGYSYRVHNIQPLLSPCTFCSNKESSWNVEKNHSSVVMVSPRAGVSAKWTRSLIRALSITKNSLEWYDDCLFDRATCQNGALGFQVSWLVEPKEEDDNFPPVVPSFIHRELSVNLLDSAIRNPNTIIALVHCDSESNILASFGVEVFCISRSNRIPSKDSVVDLLYEKGFEGDFDRSHPSRLLQESIQRDTINPEEVATQLLHALRRNSIRSETSVTTESMDSVGKRNKKVATWVTSRMKATMTIVQVAARVHRETRWENLREMQQVISSAITEALNLLDDNLAHVENLQEANSKKFDTDRKQELHDVFTIFIAWLVFLSTIIHILLKDSVVMKRLRQSRQYNYNRNGGSLFDSVLTRLKDVDDAWNIFLSWSSDLIAMKSIFNSNYDGTKMPGSYGKSPSSIRKETQLRQYQNHHPNHHHGHVRRRRKTKATRHSPQQTK